MVLISNGTFGGAQRRFLNLFFYINRNYRNQVVFFVSYTLREQIKLVFPGEKLDYIIAVGPKKTIDPKTQNTISYNFTKNIRSRKIIKYNLLYKIYYFFKNYCYQKKIYGELERYRNKYNIIAFLGIYSGIFPLYFYLLKNKRPGIIFSNMDSWFSNVSSNPRKEWYKKYVTFNYAHENCDLIDFLSPFIYEGIKKLGVKVPLEKVNITPCSFTDYSKCHIGTKSKFRIAFSGRLENDKNPVLFMHAAIELSKEHPEVEFHILGEGRLSGTVNELAKNAGLLNIFVHGFHSDPPVILAETSVFVSIQSTNNYPSQSVLEAMACGNAIIATDVGDTRKFVTEETGTLIELTLESLIRSLRKYIVQPQIALEKGIKGSQFVRKNHSIEKSAGYYMELFHKAEKMVMT